MRAIFTHIRILFLLLPLQGLCQSAYFQQGSKENILLERLEIKAGRDTALNFSHVKPFNRKWYVRAIDRLEADSSMADRLTPTDRYNIQRARINNLEWVEGDKSAYRSRKPLWNTFYKTPANLIEVDQPDFFLSVNPVLQLNYIYDDANDERRFLNTRGFVARGLVSKRFGFQTYLTENQERAPLFVQEWIPAFQAVPGAGKYKPFKNSAVDYWDARGSFMFNAAKYLDIQFGYDRMHLGNGYRSLYFSEFSNSHLFLNLNLRVWKLNYMSRVMELSSQYYIRNSIDTINPKKYMALHHISFTAPKWLTLGLFEGVVFGRVNQFEFGYLNPVIFLRPVEAQIGSPDNAFVGFDAKANIAKRIQLYGQVMLDEFLISTLREGRKGYWTNKWAVQAGLKHVDLFGIDNLDLQLEANLIRPFTYSHRDTVANYSHYNQPIAHPLMSNIQEFIGILRYQPAPRWYMQGRMIYWIGGKDVNGVNYGNNIFRNYLDRPGDTGFFFGSAEKTRWMNANLWVAYEMRENLFLELNANARKAPDRDLNIFGSVGLRWNMHRREYDF